MGASSNAARTRLVKIVTACHGVRILSESEALRLSVDRATIRRSRDLLPPTPAGSGTEAHSGQACASSLAILSAAGIANPCAYIKQLAHAPAIPERHSSRRPARRRANISKVPGAAY